jgi:hypothetical protein
MVLPLPICNSENVIREERINLSYVPHKFKLQRYFRCM